MVTKTFVIFLAVFCLLRSNCRADLVINEVMANEPGNQSSLQWIEIYNNGTQTYDPDFFYLGLGGPTLGQLGMAGNIAGNTYLVIVKQLITMGNEPGFESVWGNNNGSWVNGEPGEDYTVIEYPDLDLNDNGSTITLYNVSNLVSSFTWTSAGIDGVSWERYSPTSPLVANATNAEGGTPGHRNSISIRQFDLSLEKVTIKPAAYGLTNLEIQLANHGIQPYNEGTITLSYDPDGDGIVLPSDLIAYIPFPGLAADETVFLLTAVELDGVYDIINLQLPDDDWRENNSFTDVAPGSSYPPVILNEFMADPKVPLATEWVEIKNRSNLAIDLNGWSLGNADILYPIASSDLILDPAQIMVLCKDSTAFVDYYGQGGYPIRQPDGWPTLRNTGDLVQIQDNFDFTADTFHYDDGFGDNYTWGRYNASVTNVIWGKSRDVGGTPGENNSIYQPPSSTQIEVTIEPNPYSFSRDGIMHIDISVPEGEAMTARVYDRDGREVRTLIDSEEPYDESIEWDGMTDGGRALQPGIYILYVEVSGSGTYKQTIVLSP